jgi:hypothetical protein
MTMSSSFPNVSFAIVNLLKWLIALSLFCISAYFVFNEKFISAAICFLFGLILENTISRKKKKKKNKKEECTVQYDSVGHEDAMR